MIKDQLKNAGTLFILPVFLLALSKYNEQFYLQPEHKSLIPLYFIKMLLCLFGFYLSNLVRAFVMKYKSEKKIVLNNEQFAFIFIFCWFLAWYGSWLTIYYPGSYITDTLDVIKQLSFMEFHDWFSFLQPLIYLLLYQLYPHIVVIGIAQILLYALVLASIISYFYAHLALNQKAKILLFTLLVLFISSLSSITYYTFFYMRDIPFAAIHLYFAFYVYKTCLAAKQSKISKQQIIFILALGLILAIYRGESLVVLLTALFALYLYKLLTLRVFLNLFCVTLLLFCILNFTLPKILGIATSNKNHYKLTLVAYPLGFILKEGKHYISEDYDHDINVLSKVISIDGIQKYTNCYDILVFQYEGNHWNKKATEAEWKEFYHKVNHIFLHNPHLFLAARSASFFAQLFSPKYRAERENDAGRYEITYQQIYDECRQKPIAPKDQNWCELYDDKMLTVLKQLPDCKNGGVCGLQDFMKLNKINFDFHWNSVFAFLASIATLCLYKYVPITAIASAIILSRMFLVYLTAPYAFFRYGYSLYLFGIFVLIFAWLEFAKNTTRRKQTIH